MILRAAAGAGLAPAGQRQRRASARQFHDEPAELVALDAPADRDLLDAPLAQIADEPDQHGSRAQQPRAAGGPPGRPPRARGAPRPGGGRVPRPRGPRSDGPGWTGPPRGPPPPAVARAR